VRAQLGVRAAVRRRKFQHHPPKSAAEQPQTPSHAGTGSSRCHFPVIGKVWFQTAHKRGRLDKKGLVLLPLVQPVSAKITRERNARQGVETSGPRAEPTADR